MMVSPSPQDSPFGRYVGALEPETHSANDRVHADVNNRSNINDPMDKDEEEGLTVIEIEKTVNGFGFNIVGGIDNPHFPGDYGVFVSSVNPNSKSFGIVKTGDKILSLDGVDMTHTTHDEAVEMFRSMEVGHLTKMFIEREAHLRTQSPSCNSGITSISRESPFNNKRSRVQSESGSMSASDSRGRLTPHGVATIVERLRGKSTMDDDDERHSVTSYAPSTHSIIDDVPRTPRKPLSLLDPRNPSMFTEALYVSIGLGALSLAGYAVYRFVRNRH